MKNKILLTGDRPTGPLHIGHYAGSIKNRIEMQKEFETFIMVADAQAITDNYDNVAKIRENVYEVVADYLACGIDPAQANIFVQSMIPELPELTQYLLNLVSINRIGHNPTVKAESRQKGYEESVPAGFYLYPIFQVADIIAFDADVVPVGRDQAPMLELARDVAGKFNAQYGDSILVEPEALFPEMVINLPGIDGNKMSKSLGNAIYLKDSREVIAKKMKKMKSDPTRASISDPGDPDKAIAFTYLDIFDKDVEGVAQLKKEYRAGGLGDGVIKQRALEVVDAFIAPIRKRREEIIADTALIEKVLAAGTAAAREKSHKTLKRCKEAMGLNYDFLSLVTS
ncbi:MAG: Tryptophan--tRNA ligase 2 [Chlamydiia bacterium]|nr:Tryptophan--tRNA ligase 2 [Chlamydiia bacterium]